MENISIEKVTENAKKIEYEVRIGDIDVTIHNITINLAYLKKLGLKKNKQGDLLKKSIEFLLERESKGSILKSFNLSIIGKYFPEYESNIKKVLE